MVVKVEKKAKRCRAICTMCKKSTAARFKQCLGASGHDKNIRLGRRPATLHQCKRHVWGTIKQMEDQMHTSYLEGAL